MAKGIAIRIYRINYDKLKEALDAIEEELKPIRDALKEKVKEHHK